MKFPCDECLKYPICRHRTLIACSALNAFFNGTRREMNKIEKDKLKVDHLNYLNLDESNRAWNNTWEVIYKLFPNLKSIYHGQPYGG